MCNIPSLKIKWEDEVYLGIENAICPLCGGKLFRLKYDFIFCRQCGNEWMTKNTKNIIEEGEDEYTKIHYHRAVPVQFYNKVEEGVRKILKDSKNYKHIIKSIKGDFQRRGWELIETIRADFMKPNIGFYVCLQYTKPGHYFDDRIWRTEDEVILRRNLKLEKQLELFHHSSYYFYHSQEEGKLESSSLNNVIETRIYKSLMKFLESLELPPCVEVKFNKKIGKGLGYKRSRFTLCRYNKEVGFEFNPQDDSPKSFTHIMTSIDEDWDAYKRRYETYSKDPKYEECEEKYREEYLKYREPILNAIEEKAYKIIPILEKSKDFWSWVHSQEIIANKLDCDLNIGVYLHDYEGESFLQIKSRISYVDSNRYSHIEHSVNSVLLCDYIRYNPEEEANYYWPANLYHPDHMDPIDNILSQQDMQEIKEILMDIKMYL